MVGIEVQMHKATFFYSVGTGEFFGAFFDTVACLLENRQRGKNFPTLTLLYFGEVIEKENLNMLDNELTTIQKQLKDYSPKDIVWNMEDKAAAPPWGSDISKEITNLSNYFVTCNGKQLFDVFRKAIAHAKDLGTGLYIKSTFENPHSPN